MRHTRDGFGVVPLAVEAEHEGLGWTETVFAEEEIRAQSAIFRNRHLYSGARETRKGHSRRRDRAHLGSMADFTSKNCTKVTVSVHGTAAIDWCAVVHRSILG